MHGMHAESKNNRAEFSKVKKEMKVIQKSIIQEFESEAKFSESRASEMLKKINKLVELNRIFAEYSEGEAWENELPFFTKKLLELRDAIIEKELEKAKALAYEVNSLKKACHKKYINERKV